MRTGAARGWGGNFHEAGFFASDAEFLELLVPFVTEGTAGGEPVLVADDERKCALLRAALPRPEAVTFITDAGLYASPASAIEAYRRRFERHLAAGAGQIRITGEIAQASGGGRFAGWDRYESAINAVWQDYPVWSRCLYDATTVADDVRDAVERSHPRLVAPDGSATASRRYQDVAEFKPLSPEPDPLEATTPSLRLTDASPRQARHLIAQVANERFDTATRDELVLAVSEAVENSQQHGRPPTTVTAWTAADRVVVRVHDTGPGPANPLAGLVWDRSSRGGRGLWISHQLARVDVALVADAEGFTVRLRSPV
ncbi:anti-sigma factor RsbA family regulatory protein [Geodermatophilus ruber]|uniref:Histidine kinase-like ATPase domain-containing protein n=1 Tax=Geodermatophilus ruber TaxID=504800 RepID=A0A1I4A607_9ACTN|nr:anti-sigma factor RsbA family regulatory protein [Geodermatophilus ruber]SFK51276.1 Histidine kinase-like ATPase domain-containing protein [Geodermatophilus ruber]